MRGNGRYELKRVSELGSILYVVAFRVFGVFRGLPVYFLVAFAGFCKTFWLRLCGFAPLR